MQLQQHIHPPQMYMRRSRRNEPKPSERFEIKRYDLFVAQYITPDCVFAHVCWRRS